MNDTESVTQDDLDQVRAHNPAWDIAPVPDGFEGQLGDIVLKRRSLPGLEMAIRITGSVMAPHP